MHTAVVSASRQRLRSNAISDAFSSDSVGVLTQGCTDARILHWLWGGLQQNPELSAVACLDRPGFGQPAGHRRDCSTQACRSFSSSFNGFVRRLVCSPLTLFAGPYHFSCCARSSHLSLLESFFLRPCRSGRLWRIRVCRAGHGQGGRGQPDAQRVRSVLTFMRSYRLLSVADIILRMLSPFIHLSSHPRSTWCLSPVSFSFSTLQLLVMCFLVPPICWRRLDPSNKPKQNHCTTPHTCVSLVRFCTPATTSGSSARVLQSLLSDPPVSLKESAPKEAYAEVVVRALTGVKEADFGKIIEALSDAELDAALKCVFWSAFCFFGRLLGWCWYHLSPPVSKLKILAKHLCAFVLSSTTRPLLTLRLCAVPLSSPPQVRVLGPVHRPERAAAAQVARGAGRQDWRRLHHAHAHRAQGRRQQVALSQ